MSGLLRCLCIFIITVSFSLPTRADLLGTIPWKKRWENLEDLLHVLQEVPEGTAILTAAERRNPNYLEHLHKGAVSMTESTFTRKYSILDGKEEAFVQHEITINQNLSLAEAAVDLAHELTHYSFKVLMNPYEPGFKAVEFIKNGIEGKGGELHALSIECKVAWALAAKFRDFPPHSLCQPYKDNMGGFNIELAQADYYAVGEQGDSFLSSPLRRFFPQISKRKPRFTSSYAKRPYPIALLDEYIATRKAACANNNRKYQAIMAKNRQPSSLDPASQQEILKLQSYESTYCNPEVKGQHSSAISR